MDMRNVPYIKMPNGEDVLAIKDGDGKVVWISQELGISMALYQLWLDATLAVYYIDAYYLDTTDFEYKFLTSGSVSLLRTSGYITDTTYPSFADPTAQVGLTIAKDENGYYVTYGGGGDEAYFTGQPSSGTFYSTATTYNSLANENIPSKKYVVTAGYTAVSDFELSIRKNGQLWQLYRELIQ